MESCSVRVPKGMYPVIWVSDRVMVWEIYWCTVPVATVLLYTEGILCTSRMEKELHKEVED